MYWEINKNGLSMTARNTANIVKSTKAFAILHKIYRWRDEAQLLQNENLQNELRTSHVFII